MNHRRLSLAVLAVLAALPAGLAAQTIKSGPWSRSDVPEGWIVHESRSYHIQSQAGREKAKRLAEHMESMLLVYRKLFRSDKGSFKRYTIKLFEDRDAFRAYGAPPNAGAYYNPVDREMVAYDTGKWMDEEQVRAPTTGEETEETRKSRLRSRIEDLRVMDTLGSAAHEGWHQYFHWYITSWVEIPPWINEGMGDYFYCAKPNDSRSRRTLPADLGALNEARLPIVYSAVKQDKHVPLEDLIGYSKAEYYSNPSVCYAQGWALCHFLLHSGDSDYEKVIPKFVAYVRDDTNMEKITRLAFRGIDIDELEEEWKEWILGDAIEQLRQKVSEDAGVPVAESEEPGEESGDK